MIGPNWSRAREIAMGIFFYHPTHNEELQREKTQLAIKKAFVARRFADVLVLTDNGCLAEAEIGVALFEVVDGVALAFCSRGAFAAFALTPGLVGTPEAAIISRMLILFG